MTACHVVPDQAKKSNTISQFTLHTLIESTTSETDFGYENNHLCHRIFVTVIVQIAAVYSPLLQNDFGLIQSLSFNRSFT